MSRSRRLIGLSHLLVGVACGYGMAAETPFYQGKTITAIVTGVIGWVGVVVASTPAPISDSEWLALAVVLATALGVYAVPNSPT